MLVILWGKSVILLKVKIIKSVFWAGFKKSLGDSLLDHLILRVDFLVGLEVVKIFLFFFSESTEEVGVLLVPSLLCSGLHSLLPAVMVLNIQELSGVEPVDFGSVSLQDIKSGFSLENVFVLALGDGSLELWFAVEELICGSLEGLIVDVLLDHEVIPSPGSVGWVNE